jgi:dihydrolipoamide dehydrogenase
MTAARLMASIRKAEHWGIQVAEPQLDMDALHERKDLLIEGLRMGAEELLADRGVTLVQGRGRLVAQDTVEVNGNRLRTRNVVIATGSVAAQMPIAGADLPGVIGSAEALELREIPGHMAVLGTEPWDLELAQYYHLVGSKVTLIASEKSLLPEADREIGQRLGKAFHDAGIVIKRGVRIEAIRQRDDGKLAVELADSKEEVIADKVLATRRLPNTSGLGLRALGIQTAHGAVLVDEHMRTNVPHIYAVGDAVPGPMRSHKANAEGVVAAENAMNLNRQMDYDALPQCLYTRPQVAWVGLTEEKARAQGIDVMIGKVPTAINPDAMILGETAGAIKVVASARYGKILGVHAMCPGAVDLINVATVAMLSEATVRELMRFVPAHPSLGEALVDAALDVEGRSLHMPQW